MSVQIHLIISSQFLYENVALNYRKMLSLLVIFTRASVKLGMLQMKLRVAIFQVEDPTIIRAHVSPN
jgi:hypothetical protein